MGKGTLSGESLAKLVEKSIAKLRAKITKTECEWCGTDLRVKWTTIDMYAHWMGWKLAKGMEPQWLSIKCLGCRYEWNLQELGVRR